MIERYGEQIETDLFERGWDLLDYFRGARPWAQLMRLVNTLPAWSHTGRAMADDDDLQRFRERKFGPTPAAGPRMTLSGWSEFDELLATINDAANSIKVTIAQSVTERGKPAPKFKPHRRPLTAADRAERRRDRDTVNDIVAIATGKRT